MLRPLQRLDQNGERNQWDSAPHSAMLIGQSAAFPGKLARSRDAVSDPLGRWRREWDSNPKEDLPQSLNDTRIPVSNALSGKMI